MTESVHRSFRFTSELWLAQAEAAWVFVTVPASISDEIAETVTTPAGFGSVRVSVTIGTTRWDTSVFPDSRRGTYILPIKKQVRATESIDVGDEVEVDLKLLVE